MYARKSQFLDYQHRRVNSHAVAVRKSVRRRHVPLGTVSVFTRAFVFIFFSRIKYLQPGLLRISLRLF